MAFPQHLANPLRHRSTTTLVATCLAGVLGFGHLAAAADFSYQVRQGDTLISIAQRFLQDPNQFRRLQQHNRIGNEFTLRPDSILSIPADLLRREPAEAKVVSVIGKVLVERSGTAEPLAAGSNVKAGQQIMTGNDGSAALLLADGSTLRIPPSSKLQLDKSDRLIGGAGFINLVRLATGRVESSVQKMTGTASRFEINTPTAAAGVRGTEFRVAFDETQQASRSEVVEGSVAFDGSPPRSAKTRTVMLEAGTGSLVDRQGVPLPARKLLAAPTIALENPALQERPVVRIPLQALDGAVRYRMQIGSDASLQNVLAEAVVTGVEAKFNDLPDGNYFVRVRGIDAIGLEGLDRVQAFRLKARPEPPITQSPPPKGKARGSTAQFSWGESTEGHQYRFQLARDAGFKDIVMSEPSLKTATIQSPALPPGTYFWRVGSTKSNGDAGPWGDVQTFTMLPPTAPPQAAESANAFQFAWSGEPGQKFQFQVAANREFSPLIESVETDRTSHSMKRPAAGVYYMRLRATDADGFVGPYTAPQRFEVRNSVSDQFGAQFTTTDGSPVRFQ